MRREKENVEAQNDLEPDTLTYFYNRDKSGCTVAIDFYSLRSTVNSKSHGLVDSAVVHLYTSLMRWRQRKEKLCVFRKHFPFLNLLYNTLPFLSGNQIHILIGFSRANLLP